MGALDKPAALRLMTVFSGAIKGITFYPASHPSIRLPLQELTKTMTAALNRSGTLTWGVIDGTLFFEEHLFIAPSASIAELINRMIEKEIGRITLSAGLTLEELESFVGLLAVRGSSFDQIASRIRQAGLKHIHLLRPASEIPESQPDDGPEEEPQNGHLATYGRALDAIRSVCREIEQGRIPSSAPVMRVVEKMADITLHDPLTLLGLSMIKEYDNYTFNHCVNVGVLAMALGASIGLGATDVKTLGIAGQLHDIGKTMIPKQILNKPGMLSTAEFEEMKRHSELGAGIIRKMEKLSPRIDQIVLGHHLYFNRLGYPDWARTLPFDQMINIIAVADTYDATTSLRVYQQPYTPRAALGILRKLAGTLLDGTLVASFEKMMGKYPVGTLVRLDNNEVAVIYRPNPLDEETPLIRILIESDGRRLKEPREVALVGPDGSRYASIVAEMDPKLKNIDVGRCLFSGDDPAGAG